MSLDGLFIHAQINQLNRLLIDGHINKIHQPFDNELILVIRANSMTQHLLLSANPSFPRIQTTKLEYQNPKTPTNFVMLLRRYIENGLLKSIEQIENDRIIKINILAKNELGDDKYFSLILEAITNKANLYFLDADDKILATIKNAPIGHLYQIPSQTGINPFKDKSASLENLQGFSKTSLHEAQYQLEQGFELSDWLNNFDGLANGFIYQKDDKLEFSAIQYQTLLPVYKETKDLNQLLDQFNQERIQGSRTLSKTANIQHDLKRIISKNQRKIKKMGLQIDDAKLAEQYKIFGDLLITNASQITEKTDSVTLDNYYDQNQPITIALDLRYNPIENAQKYFKKYNKLKKSVSYLNQQKALAETENNYLESVLSNLEIANSTDIDLIKEELQISGYLKKQTAKQKSKVASSPLQFNASDGTLIEVGRNNIQNDQLSLKSAKKDQIWLHIKDIPGSHVIIRSNHPSQQTLQEAAQIAAYYSKARMSSKATVNYLPAGKLKKPNGAKPGFVIFENQKSIVVPIDADLVNRLRA